MYGTIAVPVDNSDHSNAAVDVAVRIAGALGSSVVGSHVYAAKLHDVRFKQMEFTLPDEYKEEEELEKQRKIHDALIARGLHLISDSYLDQMETRCSEKGIAFERKHFDGKNFEAIVTDVNASGYDLLVLGALGMGAVKDSQAGSVCERVLRRTTVDTLVVRDVSAVTADAVSPDGVPAPGGNGTGNGPIVACIDGSPRSFGALSVALALAKALGRQVQAVAVREPGRPEAELLSTHLDLARKVARSKGVTIAATLLDGPVRREIGEYLAAAKPSLVVVGRTGLDADPSAPAGAGPGLATEVGSLVEHLVRTSPCDVLLTGRSVEVTAALATDAA